MQRLYGLFTSVVGLGLAALGVRVLVSHPSFTGPELIRIIVLVLCLGIGIGFLWEGVSGARRNRVPSKPASGLATGFSLLPLACYGVLVAYACYAWFHVGHWPYYAHPDPKELPHAALLTITWVVTAVGIFSIVLVPLGFLVRRLFGFIRKQPMPWPRWAKLLFLAGAAVWVLDISAELSRLPWSSNLSWLAD
jgi:hypothetical protein